MAASQRYEVPARANQTVLDVVTHIQREIDPSLAYRFACRVGMCGSCAMTVNGRARWTCRTHVKRWSMPMARWNCARSRTCR
jgi:fumarate reductase iron-sulfur subunit